MTCRATFPRAFIAIEDKRFLEHHGVDYRRVMGALVANLRAGGIRQGSSTITMQLAGNLFPERIRRQRQTLSRKMLEARVADRIEDAYDKDEILELYLNHIYFGAGTRGIEAASQFYFRHPSSRLSLREAALLAALPKAPTRYDPRRNPELARERRNLVLTLMEEQGRISAAKAKAARAASLGVARQGRKLKPEEPFAGWFLDEVRREIEDRFGDALYRQRVRIVTTLDARAQRAAESALDSQLQRIESGAWGRFTGPRYSSARTGDEEGTDYLQGSAVFLEAQTGDILVWVGGRDFRHSHFDRVEQARRQVGSSFKPFVYAAAIAAGIPNTQLVSDQPLEMHLSGGEVWRPRNFGDSYLPMVTVRDALVQSRNVATVRLAEVVGIDRVAAVAEEAGLPDVPLQPAAALGASSATPLELTRAYTAFANLGRQVRPRFVLRVEDEDGEELWRADDDPDDRQVLDPEIAYMITDLLRDAVRRGTGTAAGIGRGVPVAGKTGTTNERQDVWFAGFTPDVVGTVWMGFDRPRTIVRGASGGTLAAPVWARIVRNMYGHRERPRGFLVPSGVVKRMVDTFTGEVLASGCSPSSGRAYQEVFLASSEPPTVCPSGGYRWWDRIQGWFGQEPLPQPTPAPTIDMLPFSSDYEAVPYLGPDETTTDQELLGTSDEQAVEPLAEPPPVPPPPSSIQPSQPPPPPPAATPPEAVEPPPAAEATAPPPGPAPAPTPPGMSRDGPERRDLRLAA